MKIVAAIVTVQAGAWLAASTGWVSTTAGTIAALAAGVAGLLYLGSKLRKAYRWTRSTFHRWDERISKLDQLADEDISAIRSLNDWTHGFEHRLRASERHQEDVTARLVRIEQNQT